MVFRSCNFCSTCDQPTSNGANYIGDFQCDDCAERSYDRWLENYYGEPGAPSLREQQVEALAIKRGWK